MTQQEQDVLEALIDKRSIEDVVSTLADICFLKAAHIRENWQDNILADTWRKRAAALNKATEKL